MQKHNDLIDEVFCQLLKQLTENRSVQTESVERGWKLLVILLNYFLPDERLRIYLLRFFYDHRNENERFGKKLNDESFWNPFASLKFISHRIITIKL